jgi:lipoprotein NlpI
MQETKGRWFVWTCDGDPMKVAAYLVVLAIIAGSACAQSSQSPQEVFNRAVSDFEAGRVVESADGFDALVKLSPSIAPELWQRGIALYYAKRYKDCRAQFELHRKVNPADVENAAWHFLCVARDESPQRARSALLPVGTDSRVPMPQIYEMFQGKRKPEDLLSVAGKEARGQFYAYLYLGLYYEAMGDSRLAVQNITTAAEERFRAAGGYMHTVARVHLGILKGR